MNEVARVEYLYSCCVQLAPPRARRGRVCATGMSDRLGDDTRNVCARARHGGWCARAWAASATCCGRLARRVACRVCLQPAGVVVTVCGGGAPAPRGARAARAIRENREIR